MLLGLDGVHLDWAGLVRGDAQDCHPSQGAASAGSRTKFAGNDGVLGVIRFLVEAHVNLVALPLLSLELDYCIADRARIRSRSIREGGEPRRLCALCCRFGRLLAFADDARLRRDDRCLNPA